MITCEFVGQQQTIYEYYWIINGQHIYSNPLYLAEAVNITSEKPEVTVECVGSVEMPDADYHERLSKVIKVNCKSDLCYFLLSS